MVEFGVDLGGAFTYVDECVARRWECSSEQLMDRALHNLEIRAARIEGSAIASGVMSGRAIRLLMDRPTWATSLVLVPDQLFRLFGDHDQILGVPASSCLVSIPMDTPSPVVAEIVFDLERGSLRPLWLGAFTLSDRRLQWCDDALGEDDRDRFE
jgi:hypothetical protein